MCQGRYSASQERWEEALRDVPNRESPVVGARGGGQWTAKKITADLRTRIDAGEYPPNTDLPKIALLTDEYGVARQTVRAALKGLESAGLVRLVHGRGARVLERNPVKIPLSRYREVLQPHGEKGPWQAACAAQGIDGRMVLVGLERVQADAELAGLLEVPVGTELVHRRRHAMIGDDRVHHVQQVWYPADLVDGTGLAEKTVVVGGAFGLLTALGHPPRSLDERITARMPLPAETADLSSGAGVPVLVVERVVRDPAGRVLELLRVVAPADQVVLLYDALPLGPS